MALQPTIPPTPVLEQGPVVISVSASNETIGSHVNQKGKEAGTQKVENDPEKALSSDDEFPDGGLKAWAVVLGVSLHFARKKDLTNVTVGGVWRSHHFRLCECVGCTRNQLAVLG